jgi:myo-inositol-1(or 4)-monophosphatase
LAEPDLALLEAAAREAGAIARARVGRPGAIVEKPGGHGPVSEVDLEIDRLLRTRLLAARPGYGWLSEETEDAPERLGAERVFIVDPIDGTRAFLAGEPTFSHSLAVAEAGRVVAGVVHLPMLERTYAAAAGRGAMLNGRRIAVSARSALEGARVLATRSQLDPALWPGGFPSVRRVFRTSVAFRLCMAAAGEGDVALSFRDTWEWDVAAGDLIAREAGAVVTDGAGRPIVYNRPQPKVGGIVVAGPALHAELMARRKAG